MAIAPAKPTGRHTRTRLQRTHRFLYGALGKLDPSPFDAAFFFGAQLRQLLYLPIAALLSCATKESTCMSWLRPHDTANKFWGLLA
jgi:hypothetical protein